MSTQELEQLNLEQLNRDFAFETANASLRILSGSGDIPLIEIKNECGIAAISLQGAHLLSWIPKDQHEVIWLSEEAKVTPGKSLRGGIPVCWPWFGAHETNDSLPAHGFARTVLWQLTNTQLISPGETRITFKLETNQLDERYQQMWPKATCVEYTLTLSKTLKLELTTSNLSQQSITIGQALHTYFNVEDVTATTVFGLENKVYLDKPDQFKRKTQMGPITINSEVDRIYLQTPDNVIINNKMREIIIQKQGSQSTIVWNPWKQVAEKMGDLGKDGYMKMLCVESANAAEDTIRINPGETHKLLVEYSVKDL
jgi:D-hexose-6-phosphate mutarotase